MFDTLQRSNHHSKFYSNCHRNKNMFDFLLYRNGDTGPVVGARVDEQDLVVSAGFDTSISYNSIREPIVHAVETLSSKYCGN